MKAVRSTRSRALLLLAVVSAAAAGFVLVRRAPPARADAAVTLTNLLVPEPRGTWLITSLVKDGETPVRGVDVKWTALFGAGLTDRRLETLTRQTGAEGSTVVRVFLDGDSADIRVDAAGRTDTVRIRPNAPPPPVALTPPAPVPPPSDPRDITPANLRVVLGPLMRRQSPTGPVAAFDARFQRTEPTIYLTEYVRMIGNPARDQLGLRIDANHYGALRARLAWSLRMGLPLNADDITTPYGRGVRMLRDYLDVVAKPQQFGVQAHRGSGLPDIEALWVLEKDPDALTYIHVQATRYTWDADGTLKFRMEWSDARQNAVALQAFSAAHRLGIPFTRSPANNQVGFDPTAGSWKAAGNRLIGWLDEYHVVKPDGSIPSPAHSGGRTRDPGVEAYFMNAMLATELLRWHGFVEPHPRALALATAIVDHLIARLPAGQPALPYQSFERNPAPDLAAYYVWPSLVLFQETGNPKYRDFAIRNLRASNDAYIRPLKQWNQTFSTGAMSAEALLAGVPWK